jgi:hypothetical protein
MLFRQPGLVQRFLKFLKHSCWKHSVKAGPLLLVFAASLASGFATWLMRAVK